MDILMLSDVYFPRVNGVSTSIRSFARELLAQGHRVTLVAPDYGEGQNATADARAREDGIELLRLPARRIVFDPEDRLLRADAVRKVQPQLAARHWDVIHIHTPFQAHRLGVRLGRACGIPTVETYHTYFEEYVAHYLPWAPAGVLRWAARALSRRLCHAVDHLVVPTQEMTEVLDGYGITTPSTVLPTGIDLDEFTGGDGTAFRQRHAVTGTPAIVTISRLAVEKNIAFLLRVAERLLPEFPGLVFLVAGEGPDAERLQALAEDGPLRGHVHFFGNLPRDGALLDCYRAGDVFVFASPTETQGLVLIEALALGVPVVSTAVMGTATVLRGTRGAVVADEDEAAFAETLAAVLRDPAWRARLAAAGPEDAAAWSMRPLTERLVEVYAALR
ncbi:MAG: glycosyltransferase [Pseudoxanthomonas suwonensis]|nr:glycosyltransferase [Pseudoxanthomonas suwonensis]